MEREEKTCGERLDYVCVLCGVDHGTARCDNFVDQDGERCEVHGGKAKDGKGKWHLGFGWTA